MTTRELTPEEKELAAELIRRFGFGSPREIEERIWDIYRSRDPPARSKQQAPQRQPTQHCKMPTPEIKIDYFEECYRHPEWYKD